MAPTVLDPRRGEYPVAGQLYKMTTVDPEFRGPWVEYIILKHIVVDPTHATQGSIGYLRLTHIKYDRVGDRYDGGMTFAGIHNPARGWCRLFQPIPFTQKGPGRLL